jgi:hypothetical protein
MKSEKNVQQSMSHAWSYFKVDYDTIGMKDKEELFDRLVEKTRNARHGVEVEARSIASTRWGGKNYEGSAYQESMRATKEGSKEIKKLQTKGKRKLAQAHFQSTYQSAMLTWCMHQCFMNRTLY